MADEGAAGPTNGDAHPLSSTSRQQDATTNETDGSKTPQTGTRPSSRRPSTSQIGPHNPEYSTSTVPDGTNLQPTQMTSSPASEKSADEGPGADVTAVGGNASPYGTRSRNRAGGSRPNYAEDRELDAELDLNATSNGVSTNTKLGQTPSSTAAITHLADPSTSGISTRRASAAVSASTGAVSPANQNPSTSRDYIPGTSTFSVNPAASVAAPPSKKRKAVGSNPATSGPGTATGGHSASQPVTRRHSTAPGSGSLRDTNMLSFEHSQGYLKHGRLKADDGTALGINDHVYLVCEPPGEPYYLARVMEFLHLDNNHNGPVDAIRVNWYYRPRDIQRKVPDTRVVFASMHSDTCPLTSLRGKCRVLHRSEIDDLEEYRKEGDCFYYERMFDRYIHRYYEVIPTTQVINVPIKVKRVLDARWKFVIVEMGRGKELTSAVKSCKRCGGYCASNDSVGCAVCHSTYHMNCVRPALTKKPSRGFAWACGPCSRAQEKKLEARNTPNVTENAQEHEEEELLEEEEEEAPGASPSPADDTDVGASDSQDSSIHPATAEQIAHARLWPYRYLGIHCRVEDALDYDDRIYPRASSRLGPRHQANVPIWHGRPVEYVKPADGKRRYLKSASHKKDAKVSKEVLAAIEAEKAARDKRPKWIMDEPPGYVERGGDFANDDPKNTAKRLFTLPAAEKYLDACKEFGEDDERTEALKVDAEVWEARIDKYLRDAEPKAWDLGVDPQSTNFLDKAVELLMKNDFREKLALEEVQQIRRRKDLREPVLTKEEAKRFDEGVSLYGSELHSVAKHVKTVKEADIVRWYYMWKKSDRGKKIWGGYEGRKGKKDSKRTDTGSAKLVDDVADDLDDSAFDNEKAAEKKRGFLCKFCLTRKSPQWRRAPAVSPGTIISSDVAGKMGGKDKATQYVVALCRRCAVLWRRYGIQWEPIDEVAKKAAQGSGRTWKRRIDEELLKELVSVNDLSSSASGGNTVSNSSAPGVGPPGPSSTNQGGQDLPRKKLKAGIDKDKDGSQPPSAVPRNPAGTQAPKKKAVEKPEGPPPAPQMPKPKILPCAICDLVEPSGDQHLSCRECRLTVHRACYGVVGEVRSPHKWCCDMCANDKNPQISTSYECVLCPVRYTEHDFVEPPKISHKKKTDKERERERLEREMAVAAADFYRKRQEDMNRPMDPREPLKPTAGNNWIHVLCAVWTPEIKFGMAKALAPSEGIGLIPSARYEQLCKVCKTNNGACVSCHQCHAPVHVGCAEKAEYTIGFDITPVKSSRRDLVNTVTLGNESGSMTAAVWCREHAVKTIVHPVQELVEGTSLNALQLYVSTYKQADLTLTGTVRKANLVNQSTKAIAHSITVNGSIRRPSITSIPNGPTSAVTPQTATRGSFADEQTDVSASKTKDKELEGSSKRCMRCRIDISPKWWPVERAISTRNRAAGVTAGTDHERTHSQGSIRPNSLIAPISSSTGSSDGPQQQITGHRLPSNGTAASASATGDSASLVATALIAETDGLDSPNTGYHCHKCHWSKLRDPSPPRTTNLAARPAPQGSSLHNDHRIEMGGRPLTATFPTWAPPPAQGPSTSHAQPNGIPSQSPGRPPPPHPLPPQSHRGSHGSRPMLNGIEPTLYHDPTSPPRRQGGPMMYHAVNGVSYMGMTPAPLPNGLSVGRSSHALGAQIEHRIPTGPPHEPSSYQFGHGPRHSVADLPNTSRDDVPVPSTNGTHPGNGGRTTSGASASPSLRNLLS
ncbi:MAG: putative PHD type zinc finger protein with BAH domain-containing protein [Caeruleum heppii]|nr:MAG: putative PHD type zinc finger protein with BAH domain-containing protein [Caeruleum heppii]